MNRVPDPLRVVLADDELLARKRLRLLLGDVFDTTIVAECANGREVVAAVREHRPQLLFLDIQMPELDGFEALAELGDDRPPGVIFVTAFDEHALRAFEYHALDYLLKPFGTARFEKALARARDIIGSPQERAEQGERMLGLIQNAPTKSPHLQRLILKSGGRIHFRNVAELDWAEAEGNYVRLHFGGESYLQRDKLSLLESRLDPRRFARPHRSVVVNIDRVRELRQVFHGDYIVVLKTGAEVPLGKQYRERFLQQVSEA